jgi:membrane protein implicated in regulation of membrane protease activity
MYDMSIVTHNYGVIGILGTILVNMIVLQRATDIRKYARTMTLVMPLIMMVIGTILFTGVIMMAAKHLDFTIENIIMIAFVIVLVVLENRRSKKLRYTDPRKDGALEGHKAEAFKIFQLEILITLSISIWMWI